MRLWKLVFIAAVAGFIHGVTSTEPPFPSLQRAAVGLTQLPVLSWAHRIGNTGQMVFAKCTNAIAHYARSRDATYLASAANEQSDVTEHNVIETSICTPGLEPREGIPGIRLTGNSLSMDVKNTNLTELLEELGETGDIEILGQESLPDIPISAKFDNMEVEEGIRQLIRIAGVENYALSHRKDSENQYTVSQIVFLPGEYEPSRPYHLAKATPDIDSQVLSELPAEVQDELAEEIPAEYRGQLLHDLPQEVLAELRKG